MEIQELMERAYDTVTVRRVYGKPIKRDGVLVIPAAAVQGGAGLGGGTGKGATSAGEQGEGSGYGGGWAVRARPVGAFVVKDGHVTWQPAVDPSRIMAIGATVLVVGFLALRSAARSWASRHGA